MKSSPLTGALCALSLLISAPLGAQSLSTTDSGQAGVVLSGQTGPGTQAPGSLTTLFASNNNFAGNMFDITPSVDLEFTSVDINCTGAGMLATIDVWWLVGTSIGNESNSAAWTFLGAFSGTSAGQDLPTPIDMSGNGVTFSAGITYGFYIDLTSFVNGTQNLHYTNGPVGGNTYANADLSLLTNAGKGPGFSGSTFQVRDWNGTLYYETSGGLTLSATGICPGSTTFDIAGATAFGGVALAYGVAGSFTIPGATCAGVVLDIPSPTLAVILTADLNGDVSLTTNLPSGACGLTVQVVDLTSCTASNAIVL